MKAKVIKTGEIVEVYHETQHGQITNIYKESVLVNGRIWIEGELDFCVKANEAPEKIYCESDGLGNIDKAHNIKWPDDEAENIEYTRTDAFIEEALKWYCLDCECNDNCKDTKCFFHNEYKRFLEGNKNACPPKFECTILNPDGSTSDNWRYRHFTRKIQDAFIEKACEWIKTMWSETDDRFKEDYTGMLIEDFKNYMKGE